MRSLKPNEIEVRVGGIKKDADGNAKGLRLLLFKEARSDMNVLDETFGLIETVEKAAQLYMLIAHLPRVNTITDEQLRALAEHCRVDYRKDFLN